MLSANIREWLIAATFNDESKKIIFTFQSVQEHIFHLSTKYDGQGIKDCLTASNASAEYIGKDGRISIPLSSCDLFFSNILSNRSSSLLAVRLNEWLIWESEESVVSALTAKAKVMAEATLRSEGVDVGVIGARKQATMLQKLNDALSRAKAVEDAFGRLRPELEKEKSGRIAAETRVAVAEEAVAKLSADTAVAKDRVTQLGAALKRMQASKAEEQVRIAAAKDEVTQLRQELKKAKSGQIKAEKKAQRVERNFVAANKKLDNRTEELTVTTAKLQEATTRIKEQEESVVVVQGELFAAKERAVETDTLKKQLIDENSVLREELDDERKGKIEVNRRLDAERERIAELEKQLTDSKAEHTSGPGQEPPKVLSLNFSH